MLPQGRIDRGVEQEGEAMITSEDEELIMRSIHVVKMEGDSAPWHITFHPTHRPDWMEIEAIMTTEGDAYFHPDWLCPKEQMIVRGNIEWVIDQPPPSMN